MIKLNCCLKLIRGEQKHQVIIVLFCSIRTGNEIKLIVSTLKLLNRKIKINIGAKPLAASFHNIMLVYGNVKNINNISYSSYFFTIHIFNVISSAS